MYTEMARCRGWLFWTQGIVTRVMVQPDETRVRTNEIVGEHFRWHAEALCDRLKQRERDPLACAEVLLHDGSKTGAQMDIGPTVKTILCPVGRIIVGEVRVGASPEVEHLFHISGVLCEFAVVPPSGVLL